jgi:peptide/nickel transport system substrate-binding protein
MRLRYLMRGIALLAVGSIVAVACGGGGGGATTAPPASGPASSAPAESSAPPATTAAPQGGSIVLGAEQWPECINPITSCSAATWYWWSVGEHVLPYAMVLDLNGNFVASPTLVEAPTLDNGGIVQSPFTITYKINPDANWADGSPITSEDFDFTMKAILNTTGAYTTVGYDKIESIDTTDPKTAVIKFTSVFVDWPDLFGGVYAGLIEKAAFPDFASSDKPDLKDEMQDSIPFSGGPWVLQSWSQDQAVFVKNADYFGKVPNLDQMTIVPRTDQATEIQSLLTGEVMAIQPQPSDVSLLDQVAGTPGVQAKGTNGAYFEALWFQHESAPISDPAVREALMYAIDRQSIIDAIIKLNNPEAEVLGCGFVSFPQIGPWCQTVQPFSLDAFPYDPAHARELLTADGYDCSTEGAACTKDGKDLVVEYSTVSTNTRRTTTQELLKETALAAGFSFKIKNYEAGILFGDVGPHGTYTVADYATGGSVDPSITASFGCDAIPTDANSFGGGNWQHWCNQDADALMTQSDQELDVNARADELNQVYALEAQDFLSLPLYVLPSVGAWRADKIGGPIDAYISSNLGMFYNTPEWYLLTS